LSFFFSSRRRHTRSKRDWSSDVCSSDLTGNSHAGQVKVIHLSVMGGQLNELKTIHPYVFVQSKHVQLFAVYFLDVQTMRLMDYQGGLHKDPINFSNGPSLLGGRISFHLLLLVNNKSHLFYKYGGLRPTSHLFLQK